MDRNTVIGMILLGILFFLFFWYTNKQQQAIALQKQRIEDSTRRANESKINPVDSITAYQDSLRRDSISKVSAAGGFTQAATGTEQLTAVENDILKATFSNKGGSLKSVELKKYNSLDSGHHVVLSGGKEDKLGYNVNTAPNQSVETSSLFFANPVINKNADGSQTVSYTLSDSGGQSITHQFIIHPHNYMLDWNIILNGADKLLTQNSLNLHWNVQIHQQQISRVYEAQQSKLSYHNEDGYDYSTATSGVNRTFDKPVDWVAFKQQFFNTALISRNKFASGSVQMTALPDTTEDLFNSVANMKIQAPELLL